jgi:hypothetical protein
MILNAFALRAAFVPLRRWLLGLAIALPALPAPRRRKGTHTVGSLLPQAAREDHFSRLFLLATVLLVLNFVSGPLSHLPLQRSVSASPRIHCCTAGLIVPRASITVSARAGYPNVFTCD